MCRVGVPDCGAAHHWTYGNGGRQKRQMEVEWKEREEDGGERRKVFSAKLDGRCTVAL